jgi:hypothetical protein
MTTKYTTPIIVPPTAPSSAPATTPQQQQRPLTPSEEAALYLKVRAEGGSALAAMQAVNPQARGRLIIAMDATASREPTRELARELMAAMFEATAGLTVKLAYYGGTDCKHSKWVSNPGALTMLMRKVRCVAGMTQIDRIFLNAQQTNADTPIAALVFVGDAMEESVDMLVGRAAKVGAPIFMFQEGHAQNPDDINAPDRVERTFRAIAVASKGAYARFDANSADKLRELLRAVAVYATGGAQALANHTQLAPADAPARLLLTQLTK